MFRRRMRQGGLAALLSLSLAGCATAPQPVLVQTIDFKKELSPFGEWIVVSPYGRVWHPNPKLVGRAFVPYVTGGQWVHGEHGWTFESTWAWGKFPFHYGRWVYVDDLDWLWSPDPDWGAAWVEWRVGGGYVGWAPLPPNVRTAGPPRPSWTFVKARFFAQRSIERFAISRDEVVRALGLADPLVAAGKRSGPAAEAIIAEGGMDGDPKSGYRVPELAVPAPPPPPVPVPEVAADESKVEEAPPEPAPKVQKKKKKNKKKKKKKKR